MTTKRARLVQLAVAATCLLLLRLKWPTVRDAVIAIDHGDLLFADFVHHYYPTVEVSIRRGAPAGGFFYPAGFAVLIAPIGLLSLSGAVIAWAVVQLGCVLWAATELAREAASRKPLLAALGTALTVTSIPILHNLKWGQVSILILATAGGAFIAYARDRQALAALLLGVAAGIKGYPLVFIGWFLARGDLRFVVRAGFACLLTLVAMPALAMGPAHAFFFQEVSSRSVLGAAEGVLRDFNSQYAPAVLSRFHGGWDATSPAILVWAKRGSQAMLVAIAGLVVLAARSRSPAIAARREILGFILIACSLPFWLKTSWSHYFVHLPAAQTLLAAAFTEGRVRARSALAIFVLLAPSVFLSNVLGLFATEGWWYYANAGSLFFANTLVLAAAAAFVVDAHVRERFTRSAAPRQAEVTANASQPRAA